MIRVNSQRALAVPAIALLFLSAAPVAATEDDQIVTGPAAASVLQNEMQFHFPDFDQWVFGGDGDAKQTESRMLARSELQLAELDRVCRLSDAQKEKLRLAAQGDLRRFFSEVETVRQKYDDRMKKQKPNGNAAFDEVWNELQQEIQLLQLRFTNGPMSGDSSLFMKILPQALTADQLAAYRRRIDERRRFQYEADIDVALIQFEQSIVFNETQRDELVRLLKALPAPKANSQYSSYIVLIRLACMPQDKIKPMFTAKQWELLGPNLNQYRTIRRSWIDAGIIQPEDVPLDEAKENP